jgi:hypothetical protein
MNSIVEKSLDERIAELEKNRAIYIQYRFMDRSITTDDTTFEDVVDYIETARASVVKLSYQDCFKILFNIKQNLSKGDNSYLFAYCITRLVDLGKLKQDSIEFIYNGPPKKSCFNCFKPSKLRCQNCSVKYCSTECQRCDWNFHKQICDHSKKPV